MLRLVLDWYASNSTATHRLGFESGAQWYSEALLPSRFFAKHRGDGRAEGWTHADGIVGHFLVRPERGDIALETSARQLTVTEAKMASLLSPGTKNAPEFDQAARNVACMAQVLSLAKCEPRTLSRLGFYVIAPAVRVAQGVFSQQLDKAAIERKVRFRAAVFGGECDPWLENWFRPTLDRCTIKAMSWEELIDEIAEHDKATGESLRTFYASCLAYNPILPLTPT